MRHDVHDAWKRRCRWCLLLVVCFFFALPAFAAKSGKVRYLAPKTIYIHFPGHTFRTGDILRLMRDSRPLGQWKIIAVTSKTVSAQHLSGPKEAKVGDRAFGKGSRVERAETPVKPKPMSRQKQQQLLSDIKPSIGPRVRFRGGSSIPAPNAGSKTQIDYSIMLQYLGVFARGSSFQTAVLQSQMELTSLLGSGFWHRHFLRVRYDIADPRDPWQGKYRPILDVYQLSAGYRFRYFDVGLGRLANIPSEAGVVDGLKFQIDPLHWMSIIVYGGLAPDERTMIPRISGIRYGATLQFNPHRWHRLSRVGFAGQLEQGQIDRHFVFAETYWTPLPWMDLFARGVVEVVVPENTFDRTSPEVSSITADAQISPLSWLSIGARYDAFRPALNLNWLREWKEVLPIEGYQDFFREEIRHSARLSVTLQDNKLALRGGVSGDYFFNEDHSVAATAWAHWYQINRLPLRLFGRYTFLFNPLTKQGHQANVRFTTSAFRMLELSAGYGVAAYLTQQDIWQLEHTIRSEIHWMLPLGFSVLLAGQFRVGDFDRSLLIYAQLRWGFQR